MWVDNQGDVGRRDKNHGGIGTKNNLHSLGLYIIIVSVAAQNGGVETRGHGLHLTPTANSLSHHTILKRKHLFSPIFFQAIFKQSAHSIITKYAKIAVA